MQASSWTQEEAQALYRLMIRWGIQTLWEMMQSPQALHDLAYPAASSARERANT